MHSKATIQQQIKDNYESFAQFVEHQAPPQYETMPNGKWSSGQNLDHLNRAIRPVNLALSLPKPLLRLLFGKAKRSSRNYDEVVANYQTKLAAGAKASRAFVPPQSYFDERASLLKKFRQNYNKMADLIEKWSEDDLDSLRLPHPILGKLTVREMLFFTIYHAEHHLKSLKTR
ncbi:MAG: DinB family protein [Saprospiraceae bacterium]|nr:DinB family protein [Saprospiraceae bacterium]